MALLLWKSFSVNLFGLFRVGSSNGFARWASASSSSSSHSVPLIRVRGGGRRVTITWPQQRQLLGNKGSFFPIWCSRYGSLSSAGADVNGGPACDAGRGYLELTDQELMRQCQFDTFKASGPGGQHRNKRESGVRLKHLPTGLVAQVCCSSVFLLCFFAF